MLMKKAFLSFCFLFSPAIFAGSSLNDSDIEKHTGLTRNDTLQVVVTELEGTIPIGMFGRQPGLRVKLAIKPSAPRKGWFAAPTVYELKTTGLYPSTIDDRSELIKIPNAKTKEITISIPAAIVYNALNVMDADFVNEDKISGYQVELINTEYDDLGDIRRPQKAKSYTYATKSLAFKTQIVKGKTPAPKATGMRSHY
jgi:hypothetical protein